MLSSSYQDSELVIVCPIVSWSRLDNVKMVGCPVSGYYWLTKQPVTAANFEPNGSRAWIASDPEGRHVIFLGEKRTRAEPEKKSQ